MKIKDKVVLGLISGVAANQAKEISSMGLRKVFGLGTINGPKKAAGIFFPRYKIFLYKRNKKVRIIGHIVDNTIGGVLGMAGVYMLVSTGRQCYITKGFALGHIGWVTLYGVLSRFATSLYPLSEDNNLNALLSHTIFGVTTAVLAANLGCRSIYDKENTKET